MKNAFGESAETIKAGGSAGIMALGMLGPVAMEMSMMFSRATSYMVGSIESFVNKAAEMQNVMLEIGVITGKSTEQVSEMQMAMIKLTTGLPTTATDLARATLEFIKMGIGEGMATEELMKLGLEAIKFGRAIGVSDEKAALFLGKLTTWLAIADPTADKMARIASTVTMLGWRIKGTAEDVIKAAERFGAFVRAMGASEADTLALASMVNDSGIMIRRGSTAINRTFQLMAVNVDKFGYALEGTGTIAKGEGKNFAKTFDADPIKAFTMVLDSLNSIRGAEASVMLKNVGLHGNYISDLITMSRNVERFRGHLEAARAQMNMTNEDMLASRKAFDVMSKSYENSIKILKGATDNLKILMGSELLKPLANIFTMLANAIGILVKIPYLMPLVGHIALVITGLMLLASYLLTSTLLFKGLEWAGMKALGAFTWKINWVVGRLFGLVGILLLVYEVINAIWQAATGNEQTMLDWAYKNWWGKEMAPVAGPTGETQTEAGVQSQVQAQAEGRNVLPVAAAPALMVPRGAGAIPHAQEGLTTNRGTPAMIGEKGPEFVSPINDLVGILASALERANIGGGAGGRSLSITTPVYLDGAEIARVVQDRVNIDAIRSGRSS
jgi:TP901 family phage tail tape measure protein